MGGRIRTLFQLTLTTASILAVVLVSAEAITHPGSAAAALLRPGAALRKPLSLKQRASIPPALAGPASSATRRDEENLRMRGGDADDTQPRSVRGLIFFDEESRVFRLYGRNSMYAFRADEGGDLQHVYWGKPIPPSDDLRFTAFSNVAICFDPGPYTAYEDPVQTEARPYSLSRASSFSDSIVTRAGVYSPEVDRVASVEFERAMPHVGRNTKLLEYADVGTGDYRAQSFSVVFDDGGSISPITYKKHTIIPGKLPMSVACGKSLWGEDETVTLLPELRGGATPDDGTCTTLLVEMEDTLTGLEFDLIYTVYRDLDAISRRVIVRNPKVRKNIGTNPGSSRVTSAGSVRLEKLMSATVDFHTRNEWNLATLSGSWANERRLRINQLKQGRFVVESIRGASSHQHNPFCALTTVPEDQVETQGEVWAFSLVYSGNFQIEADVSETGRVRINAGINPRTFCWHLTPGDSWESPECVLVYSSTGLEGISHTYHDLYRKYLIPDRWFNTVPPVLLNTWEAMYFDVSHDKVIKLATAAARVGVEMIVLDDGWFGSRSDATSSLGDWYEDRRKFPEGLPGLVRDVNDLGLKFGLWVEPEMVNVRSKLYRALPTWTLNQHGRKSRCEGRNQLVLDFTLEGVVSYVISKLSALLSSSNIEYLKWDMNRHLTEVYGNSIAHDKQGEVFHRYMLGVYKVLTFLNDKFPSVRIETCSGGGGRFDPGMLCFSPQIWASDNTDVFSRMQIQHGTSIVYPLQSIGSHITAVPNHQTHRSSTLKARFLVALFGTFGLELDVSLMPPEELDELSKYIKTYKKLASVILSGRFHRLWSPHIQLQEQNACAWMVSKPDAQSGEVAGVVAVFLIKMLQGKHLPRLNLRGLEPGTVYIVEEIFPNKSMKNTDTGAIQMGVGMPMWNLGKGRIQLTGATLMNVGVPVRLSFDGDCCAFVLYKK